MYHRIPLKAQPSLCSLSPLLPHFSPPSLLPSLPPSRARPTRAYKVAGFTLLGCVLVIGQVVIAYILLTQRSEIQALKTQSNNLKTEMVKEKPGEGAKKVG